MGLHKVLIKDDFNEYINGKEVHAVPIDDFSPLIKPGEHVIAFKDSIAAEKNIPVPKAEQSHFIGIEGTVTNATSVNNEKANAQLLTVRKV